MQVKIVPIKIGAIKYSVSDLSGADELIAELTKRIGIDARSALLEDFHIRVKSLPDGRYELISGHQIFRLAKAWFLDHEEISVKVCADNDVVPAEVREAVSCLLVPALMGRSSNELLDTLSKLKKHPGLPKLGMDLYLEKTWRAMLGLDSGKRTYVKKKLNPIVSPTEQRKEGVAVGDAAPGTVAPPKKSGRRKKMSIGSEDTTSSLAPADQAPAAGIGLLTGAVPETSPGTAEASDPVPAAEPTTTDATRGAIPQETPAAILPGNAVDGSGGQSEGLRIRGIESKNADPGLNS